MVPFPHFLPAPSILHAPFLYLHEGDDALGPGTAGKASLYVPCCAALVECGPVAQVLLVVLLADVYPEAGHANA